MKKYPDFSIDWKSARTQKKARPDKDFSYEKMEEYIATFNNADELLEIFEKVKVRGRITASPRKYVSDWFKAQFPNYKECPTPGKVDQKVDVVDAPDTNDYKAKGEKTEEADEREVFLVAQSKDRKETVKLEATRDAINWSTYGAQIVVDTTGANTTKENLQKLMFFHLSRQH